jgi:hypothetical protein
VNKYSRHRDANDRRQPARAALRVAVGVVVMLSGIETAAAQWWPWGQSPPQQNVPAPIPRESVRPQTPGPAPYGQPGRGGSSAQAPSAGGGGICLQLEQRLAQDSTKGNQSKDQLPKIEAELRVADKAARAAQADLEKQDCFEYFLFSKTLKRDPVCRAASAQLDASKRRVGELDAQRQQLMSSGGRSYQDDIIRELARNNCGNQYSQEASRRGPKDVDEEGTAAANGQFGNLGFKTFRTVCVRLCDGYYFPISYSTMPQHFDRDAESCQSKCAAPVELHYYENPGQSVDQSISFKTKQSYKSLKVAGLYRDKFLPGCSCKQAEYLPAGGAADRRADAVPGAAAAAVPPKR